MSYLRTFAPWIVYAVVPSSHWQWGALLALLITAAEVAWYLVHRTAPDAMLIELGSLVFFAVITAVALADPQAALHAYTPALANGWLAVIAWFSLAIGRPFTLGIAKQSAPREIWDHPIFRRTNLIITLVWAVAFTAGAAALGTLALAAGVTPAASLAIQISSFALPMLFTIRYAAAVRARAGQPG